MPILSLLDLFNKNVIRCRVIMFCERLKNPYKGLSNLVGGKIEDGEKGIDAAYRELLEETNISRREITLHHLMDFEYYFQDCYVEVYVGRLKRGVSFSDDEIILYWSNLDNNFFNMSLYTGEGNIGHMIEQINFV
nr:NUDIX hydrolase [Bacillus sp. Cs-700]